MMPLTPSPLTDWVVVAIDALLLLFTFIIVAVVAPPAPLTLALALALRWVHFMGVCAVVHCMPLSKKVQSPI